MWISATEKKRLERAARKAVRQSYFPYSGYPVGAAVLTGRRKIFSGCNVENASYGLTNCAERTAIFKAVSEGQRTVTAVCIYVPAGRPATPCGACRQVIREFGPHAEVVCVSPGHAPIEMTLDELLPRSFGPEALAPRTDAPAGKRKR